jgi:hypothetical protein
MSPCAPFQRVDDEKTRKTSVFLSNCLLLPAILARLHQPVASVIALDPFHWAMCAVSYWRTTTAIEMASKYGAFFVFFFLACNLVVRWDDTEGILAQKRCPVASNEALEPLHWAMYAALHRRISTTVKLGWAEVHLIHINDFAFLITIAN